MTHPHRFPPAIEERRLIIGATGSFGGHAAAALLKHGWSIRALARDPEAARRRCGDRMPIDWIRGDAMNPADVIAAAAGVDVIVHAANPPAYRNWRGLAPAMLASSIAAARASGARIVLPGNVYNFSPNAGPAIAEDAPQVPGTRKGRIRVEMEETLRSASAEGVRVLIVRAGDYFGPAAPNSGLGWITTRRGGKLRSIYALGPSDVGHAWAYLPDLAETTARLLDREADLTDFEVFHFRGHWLEGAGELAASIRRVTGRPDLPIRPFPIRSCGPWRPSSRRSVSCSRCAICGAGPSASTGAGWRPSWAPCPRRPSMRPSAPPSMTWASSTRTSPARSSPWPKGSRRTAVARADGGGLSRAGVF